MKIRKEKGFTIIEVMIVLAIAGLIMAIVFVAVPSLQRNSRNTQRRSDASHMASLISEYASNHAGTLPTAICSSGASCAAGSVDIRKEKWSIMGTPSSIAANATFPATTDVMNVNTKETCDPGTNTLSVSTSPKTFAITYLVETSGGTDPSCLGD